MKKQIDKIEKACIQFKKYMKIVLKNPSYSYMNANGFMDLIDTAIVDFNKEEQAEFLKRCGVIGQELILEMKD